MAAGDPGGLRDGRFMVSPCLSTAAPYGRGEGEDFGLQTMTDFCRMTFADDRIDSSGSRHWLTMEDSLIQPQQFVSSHQPPPPPSFTNAELLQLGVRVDGVGGGEVGGGGGTGGFDRRSYVMQSQYGLSNMPVRDSTHGQQQPLYFPDAFDRTALDTGVCNDIMLGSDSLPLSSGIGLPESIAVPDSEFDGSSLRGLNELQYQLDIPLLLDDDDGNLPTNFLMNDDLGVLRSNPLICDSNDKLMLGHITNPRISSGCTVTSVGDKQTSDSVTRILNNGCSWDNMLRIPGASGSDAMSKRQSTSKTTAPGSRKVLKANRKLREDSSGSRPMTQNISKPISDKMDQTKVSQYVVKCLTEFGICVVDKYMSAVVGNQILNEVQNLEMKGMFRDGQLMCETDDTQAIRGDKITWVERNNDDLKHIPVLIRQLDNLLDTLNGRIGAYRIKSRSKAMVACYPGHGKGYMRHVDNATQDGRCITCIYYLNKDWNAKVHGGLLRMFPVQFSEPVDVEPKFDRLLLFWSDHRNPHEVQPAYRDRYAITVWYFDEVERQQAKLRHWNQGTQPQSYPMQDDQISSLSLSCGPMSRSTVCDNRNEIR